MHVAALRQRLRSLGALPTHERQVLRRWALATPQDGGRRRIEHYLPLRVRAALPALVEELAGLARIRSEHPSTDGSIRLLVALADGQSVEAVLLPKGGLCVSTQAGCAVGCVFCKTGESGLLRQMGSAEIVAQVALARSRRSVTKVVFMGMGEPAHNLDAVMEAIDLLGREGGIAHKNLVLSTVGDMRVFERLAGLVVGDVRPALALSLHSTHDARRATLLPRAPEIDVAELVAQGERYARAIGYPIQYQWTLLAGVNDGDDEIEGLIALLRGKYAILNMIPYNHVEGFRHRRPDAERCTAIFRRLNQRGVLTRMRQSAGQDVDAGCGQLRSRVIALQAA
ncbi:MAG: RNA methyltransferase [Aquincola sp.]|nr:RNA methyltransferase [Aquincola sp.]MDH4289725.1 RNA methyltransferase [Aquincola sp.]MDH5328890.1 RNA methyltransferase [Aquincola sp.]